MLTAVLWDVDGTLAETKRDGHLVAFDHDIAEHALPWCWRDRFACAVCGADVARAADVPVRLDDIRRACKQLDLVSQVG